MRILDLALKDLSQMLRDKRSLLFIVVMPIVFTFFMGFAMRGGSSNEETDSRIPLALVDPQPESRLNKMFFTRLDSSDSIRIVVMNEEAKPWTRSAMGKWLGCWIIPLGSASRLRRGRKRS
jgi:hypothetical protein